MANKQFTASVEFYDMGSNDKKVPFAKIWISSSFAMDREVLAQAKKIRREGKRNIYDTIAIAKSDNSGMVISTYEFYERMGNSHRPSMFVQDDVWDLGHTIDMGD